MTQARSLQLIATLVVVLAAAGSAVLAGANTATLAIMIVSGLLLIFVLRERDGRQAISAPPSAAILDEPDILEDAAFRRVINGLSDPVLVVQKGRVAMANGPALQLLGSHIVGEDVRIAIRHPAAAERLAGAQSLTGPVRIDVVGLGARSQRWAMRIVPMDADDRRQRLFVHLSDETGLHAADRVRGDFVANASHELRTPLAAILGFIETLQDPDVGTDGETRRRFLSIMESEARRMQQLIDDLISLSRIEGDKHRLPTTVIVMPDLIEETVALCRQNLGSRGVDIVTRIRDDVPSVQGDRTQIAQLLHNLIGNAAKYGRPGTPIIVGLDNAPSRMIRIEVCDEGEGIPAEHLPRLTERFYRVDSGRSRAMGGTGLGLAIVKHIVERHRGRLDIVSRLGQGTTVTVLLPRVEESSGSESGNDAAVSALS